MQRHLRNVLAARQHLALSEEHYETAGRYLLAVRQGPPRLSRQAPVADAGGAARRGSAADVHRGPTARGRSPAPRPQCHGCASQEKPEVVLDHSEAEPRRACTDAASVSRADVVISMSMQASVTDWP